MSRRPPQLENISGLAVRVENARVGRLEFFVCPVGRPPLGKQLGSGNAGQTNLESADSGFCFAPFLSTTAFAFLV